MENKLPVRINRIGHNYGKLTVIGFDGFVKHKNSERRCYKWKCKCSCGGAISVESNALISKKTRSCGCIKKGGPIIHGQSGGDGRIRSAEYTIWHLMKQRCRKNSTEINRKSYFLRGVKVCKRWRDSFLNFFQDMGPRPKGHSIDRIDNSKGYYPSNCKWSTQKEQCNNTSKNIFLTHKGERKTVAQWSDALGVSYSTIYTRIHSGWSVDKTLSEPARVR